MHTLSRRTVSRRTVILSGIGVAGIAALGAAVGTSLWPEAAAPELVNTDAGIRLARSRFAPLVGTTFTAHGDQAFPLILETVADLSPVRTAEDEDRFNLLFSTVGASPPQGIYTLRHPETTDSVLFISPVGQEGPGLRLQALVDRSV